MKKSTKFAKIISIMLCLMMVLSLFPATALATTDTEGGGDADTTPPTTTETPTDPPQDPPKEEGSEPTDPPTDPPADEELPPDEELPSDEEVPPDEELPPDGDVPPTSEFVVTFHANGDVFLTVSVTGGNAVSEPEKTPAAPDGMEFSYWYSTDESTPYSFGAAVTADLDLYAKFTEITTDGEDTMDGMAGRMAMAAGLGGIEDPAAILWTYHYVVNGAETGFQTLVSGETLVEPAAPTPNAGERFVGWFDGDTQFTAFTTQTFDVAGDTVLTARFTTAYYAFFHNKDGAVIETRLPGADNLVSTANVPNLILGENEKLTGWSTTSGGTTDVGATVSVTGANVDLYPIVKGVVWITFDTNGGTYIPPMAIGKGDYLSLRIVEDYIEEQTGSDTITRDGYDFVHWVANGGYFVFGWIYDNMTLTAIWMEESVPYTVVYWKQSLEGGDNYYIDSTTSRNADAGDVVSASSSDQSKFTGFTFVGAKSPAVTVAADGSTQLNLYYNRKNCSLDFQVPVVNGSHYEGNYNSLTKKTGVTGAAIGYWPSTSELTILSGYVFLGWYTAKNNGNEVQRFDTFENTGNAVFDSNGNLTLYARFEDVASNERTFTVNHYLETAPGVYSSTPDASRSYTYNKNNVTQTYTFSNAYSGYTVRSYTTSANSSKTNISSGDWILINPWLGTRITVVNVYYTINKYNLSIYNGSTRISSNDVVYLTSLSGYQPATTPDRPSGVDPAASWAGWYTTSNGMPGSEMNWNRTMPAGDLRVYGVWKTPVYTGVAHLTPYGTSGGTYALGSISYGGKVSTSALSAAEAQARLNPPHAGDTFVGWVQMVGGSQTTFNPNTPVYGDIEIYPNWTSSVRYTVAYALNTTGTAPVDANRYAPGSQAFVLAFGSDVTAPSGKVFVGWKSDLDGKIYYPGGSVIVSNNVTLTAQWADEAPKVRVSYYGNGGTLGDGVTTSFDGAWVANNTYYNLDRNGFTRTGYTFKGWNTLADGSGRTYQPGDAVLLGMSGTVSGLFAKWEPIAYAVRLSLAVPGTASALTGAGDYDYHTDATLSWTPASGYLTVKVTDNGTDIPMSGNSYTINAIEEEHDVVVTLEQQVYTLTYVARNGSPDESMESVVWNAPFTVADNMFSFTGNYFLGWSLNPSATAPDPAYAPGTEIAHMPASDVKLYAVWGTKTALTITSNGDTFGFDGSAHSVSGFTASESGLLLENISAGASGTNPGEYTAAFTGKENLVILRASDRVDVTDQYTVTWVEGTLTINPLVSYVDSINGDEYASEHVTFGTGDASYSTTPPSNVTDSTGNRYYWDGTYDVAPGDPAATDLRGNLTITANYTANKTLVITGKTVSLNYNGSEQTVTEAELSEAGLNVTGYSVLGAGTNVGEYDVNVTLGSVKILSGGVDVTYQYDVVTAPGKLTIQPIEMNVSATGFSGPYDGSGHSILVTVNDPLGSAETQIAYSYSAHKKPEGYRLTTNPSIKNVAGSRTIYFVVTNPNYLPYFGSADISISAIPITVQARSQSWVYDGTDHTWQYYDVTAGSFVGRQGIATAIFDAASHITNVGPSVANTITGVTLKANTNAGNYNITFLPGTLSVTKAPAPTLKVTDTTALYDGRTHSVAIDTSGLPSGTELYYNRTGGTDLTAYTLGEYAGVNVADNGLVYVAAVNPNYETAFGSALLTITPRNITLTSDSASKVYDGFPLMAPTVTPSGDGFATGEGFATAPASMTAILNAGTVDNLFTVPAMAGGTLAGNYVVHSTYGTLTVERRNVLIVADDATKNFGDPDPVFTYHFSTGVVMGRMFYDVLPAHLAGVEISTIRVDAGLPTGEDPGLHSSQIFIDLGAGSTIRNGNYAVYAFTGSLTINPQITYLTGTTDVVTGMPATQWTPYDTTATLSTGATAVRTGYALTGWLDATSTTTYALGATIPNHQKNLVLTAQWTPNVYSVTFQTGTGAAVANMPANIPTVAYLTTVTLPAAIPTRVGYTFDGWVTTEVDGVARTYGAGGTFVMPNNGVTLTAAWAPNLYTVTYLSNFAGGGSFVDGAYAMLTNVTVAGNGFTRRGYRFLGWSSTATGAVTSQPGGTFVMPAEPVRYYAQWQQLEYRVDYYVTGGNTAQLNGTSPYATYTGLHYGDPMPRPNDPTLDGYTFNGWTGLPATVPEGGLRVNGSLVLQSQVAPLTERIDDQTTPLAGKSGIPLWAILAGAGLLGLGLLWLLLLLAKRRKEEEQQQGAK
ncbi:MAG: InlB B-repeat-containing protein [Christensenella sp.]|nr:InlB B-repeat-containing protein [Christensenella sp.]